jgi:hypothetical protein
MVQYYIYIMKKKIFTNDRWQNLTERLVVTIIYIYRIKYYIEFSLTYMNVGF